MPRVFISYKRADKEKVFPLKDKIEAAIGEPCWIDLDGIESDAQFVNVIMQAIDDAEIFLFMYSKEHSCIKDYEKDWTVREINYAQDQGKRIVFINIDKTPLTKWFKFMFGLKQQVDATSQETFNAMLKDLQKWLGLGCAKQPLKEHTVVQGHVKGKLPSIKENTMDIVSRNDDKETDVWLKSKSTYSGLKHYINNYSSGKYINEAKRKIVLYKIFVLPLMYFAFIILILIVLLWPLLIGGIIAGLSSEYGTVSLGISICLLIVNLFAFNIIMYARNNSIENGKSHWIEPIIIGFKRIFRF